MERFHTHLSDTLTILQKVKNYNKWLYEQFAPYVGRFVLEIGAGVGNITEFLRTQNRTVFATDISDEFVAYLTQRYSSEENVIVFKHNAENIFHDHEIDTIVCINVLEHIEDDRKALRSMFTSLLPLGHLILLVPAHPFLYGSIDRAIGHFRRYRKKELCEKIRQSGFLLKKIYAFNPVGTLGWFLQGKIMKVDFLEPRQTLLFDRIVPILKRLPFQRNPFFGISFIAIAQKPETA